MSDPTLGTTIDPRLDEIDDCLYRIASKCLIIEDGKLLLVKELEENWWSLPGGGVDYGETILIALKREISEEIGVEPEDVSVEDHILLITTSAVVNGVPRANIYYRVKVPNEKIKVTDQIVDYDWFTYEEFLNLNISPSLESAEFKYMLEKQLNLKMS